MALVNSFGEGFCSKGDGLVRREMRTLTREAVVDGPELVSVSLEISRIQFVQPGLF